MSKKLKSYVQARRASHEDLSLDFPLYSFPPPDIPPHNLSLRSADNVDEDHAADNVDDWRSRSS